MSRRTFSVTYDYLCPFACLAHEMVGEALRDGAPWDVSFVPFSLSEVHVEEGEASVWDLPLGARGTRGVRAHAWALAASEQAPDRFLDFHLALFEARHRAAEDVDDEGVLRRLASSADLDAEDLAGRVAGGDPVAQLAERHTEAVKRHAVFGVPTFIAGDEAVFVRFMRRDRHDLERVLDMLSWSNLNEFKRTTIPR